MKNMFKNVNVICWCEQIYRLKTHVKQMRLKIVIKLVLLDPIISTKVMKAVLLLRSEMKERLWMKL